MFINYSHNDQKGIFVADIKTNSLLPQIFANAHLKFPINKMYTPGDQIFLKNLIILGWLKIQFFVCQTLLEFSTVVLRRIR